MGDKYPHLFRVTGISRAHVSSEDALRKILMAHRFGAGEAKSTLEGIEFEVELVPSLSKPAEYQNAIISLEPPIPAFRNEIDKSSVKLGKKIFANIDKDFFGLTHLYETTAPANITMDIIAVTGMNAHAYGSWTSKRTGCMWLRDFLPNDDVLKNCRTMTYGYNANWTSHAANHMANFVETLLQDVMAARRSPVEKKRPIVFIGHSFGGLLITSALATASIKKEKYGEVLEATQGLVFFGVPHRGIEGDDYKRRVADLDEACQGKALVDGMFYQHGGAAVGVDMTQFLKEVEKNDIPILTFYEADKGRQLAKSESEDGDSKSSWGNTGDYIIRVKPLQAVLQLRQETAKSVDADHSSMVKFDSDTNTVYESVANFLKGIASTCRVHTPRKTIIPQSGDLQPAGLENELPPPQYQEKVVPSPQSSKNKGFKLGKFEIRKTAVA